MNRPKITSQDDPGLRRMAHAVLMQALADLSEGDAVTRSSAWQWLNGENEDGFSFALCSRMLGHRPEDLLNELLPAVLTPDPVVAAAHLASRASELTGQLAG